MTTSRPKTLTRHPLIRLFLAVFLITALATAARQFASTPPRGITPLDAVDLHKIRGPWFEIARLSSPLEDGFHSVNLDIRYTGAGSDLTFAYPDAEDPRFRIILTGRDASDHLSLLLDKTTDRIDDFNSGSLFMNCRGVLRCGFHLIAYDNLDRSWMVVAGPSRNHLWVFSRAPGFLPITQQRIWDQLKTMGYDLNLLTLSQNLPGIPATPPATPEIPPPFSTLR
jgi:apolipoprotein D and lipocalin family protein